MEEWFPNISDPPNHNTTTISNVPKNSLIGCANAWRMATLLVASRNSLLHSVKRFIIFCSAIKALIIRSPPKVSSSWDIVSLHLACASSDCLFNFLPTLPMIHPIPGTTNNVNKVSCQLVIINVPKYMTIRIGFLINISNELVIEFSTSPTSPLIRAMMSPLRSSEKKPNGKLITLE